MVRADEPFFEDIMSGAVANQAKIDEAISKRLTEKWPLRRLDATLRALLRSATYEIQSRPDVPALVIINEYMSIATEFFSGKEPGIVNGVLDKIAKDTRAAEFGLTPSHVEAAKVSKAEVKAVSETASSEGASTEDAPSEDG